MARSRRWRRRIVRSVVLGVISSVVLSQALGVVGGNAKPQSSATVQWRSRVPFRTSTDYYIQVPPQSDPGHPMHMTARRHMALALRDRYLGPDEPRPEYTGPDAQGVYAVRLIRATTFGIPFESFWGYYASDGLNQASPGTVTVTTRGDWLRVAFGSKARPGARVFPYYPLWGGLAANAIVHSAAWVVLFTLLAALRTGLRGWRGQCLACGYSRRGIGAAAACPECPPPPPPPR